MKIEVPVKWLERVIPEGTEDYDALTRRVLYGDDNEFDEGKDTKVTYGPLVIDLDDIGTFHRLDEEHTIIRNQDGDGFCLRIPYENFKDIYIQETGQYIKEIQYISPEEDNAT